MVQISKLLTKDKSMIMAYDHGVEHGPSDFNMQSIDPETVMNIALEGKYDGIVLHNGTAEKYYHGPYKDVPLIIKLNGKTNISHINPVSRQICSVERAIKLGAAAVGYTIYDGSPAESVMFKEFGTIVEQAHEYGLPVVAWMYPRGPEIKDETTTDMIAYAARLGLEMGADFVKLKYNNDEQGFGWAVKCAGRCRVLLADSHSLDERTILEQINSAMRSGATGCVVDRTVWQHPKPFSMTKAIRQIVFESKSVDRALQNL